MAFIKINLSDEKTYDVAHDTGREVIYGTNIESLIYDNDNNIIASDNSWEGFTSEYFILKSGEVKTIKEESDEQIIKGYMSIINHVFESIKAYKGDTHKHYESMRDSGMDWDDILYNEDLWSQYKPLYDLLNKKGLGLDLTIIY